MKRPSTRIAALASRISKTCEGHDNAVVLTALMSVASNVIGENAKSLPDALIVAHTCGLDMASTIAKLRTKP